MGVNKHADLFTQGQNILYLLSGMEEQTGKIDEKTPQKAESILCDGEVCM